MAPNFVLAAVAVFLVYSGWKGASLKNTLQGGEADQGGPNLSNSASGVASSGGVTTPGGEEAGGTITSTGTGGNNPGPSGGGSLPPNPSSIRLPKRLSKGQQELATAEAVIRKDFPHWPRNAVRVRAQLLVKAKREGR